MGGLEDRDRMGQEVETKSFIYLFIYLFSFFPVGRGTLLQVSSITAGPFVQVCSGGGNSPQHQHWPTLIDKCVGSFKSPDRTSRD